MNPGTLTSLDIFLKILAQVTPIIIAIAAIFINKNLTSKKVGVRIGSLSTQLTELSEKNDEDHIHINGRLDKFWVNIQKNNAITDRYLDNEGYYGDICATVAEACRFISENKVKVFLNTVAELLNTFSRVILSTDESGTKDDIIDLNGVVLRNGIKAAIYSGLGEKRARAFWPKLGTQIDMYLSDVKRTQTDIVNDRTTRFRTESRRMVQIFSSDFIKFYMNYKNSQEVESNGKL